MPDAPNRWQGARPDGWVLLKRNRPAMCALWFLGVVAACAVVIPMLLPAGLTETSSGVAQHDYDFAKIFSMV